MGVELEYKFKLPTDQEGDLDFYGKASAWSFFGTCTAGPERSMHTLYFDTSDRELDRHRAVLRLRQEGNRQVMTLKMSRPDTGPDQEKSAGRTTDRHLHRNLEFSVELERFYKKPPVELFDQLYPEWRAELTPKLAETLPRADEVCCEAAFIRRQHLIRIEETDIEVAVDIGLFKNQGREKFFAEVEFELKAGKANRLQQLAAEVARRYRLEAGIYSKYQQCKAL